MTDIVPATRPATVVARLTKRSEYLQAARGARTSRRGFLLQSIPRPGAADGPPRFGFTVTKKIGNAVVRNRIRRRLKEAVRLQGAMAGTPGIDYVLIGRTPALDQPFAALMADVADAIAKAGRGSPKAGGSGRSSAGDRRQSDDARKRAIDG